MTTQFNDTVSPSDAGQHLYQFLRARFPYLNEQTWQAFVDQGEVAIDGVRAEGDPQLEPGQVLSYRIGDYFEGQVDTGWKLLWQGEEIIAVHKPHGLPVSRTTRNIINTLAALVRRDSDWPEAHLLHRLDLETGGIVLLGKDKAAASRWQPRLKQLMVRKVYHAVLWGLPSWDEREFECRLGTRADSPIRCQMHVCGDDDKGKQSRTQFRVLARGDDCALVECQLVTGRKHQIRAHLAHLGHPIVGDKIYSGGGSYYLKRLADAVTDADEAALGTPHHLLFARELTIETEPGSKQVLTDKFYSEAWHQFSQARGLPLL
ncbi:RluA family pseudouridine synthase [Ferrimonas sediminicola]|uniref:RluA family pseudouridine synthase n=1 Tax=Ferrimonas sediminicola TaxID=2569538 RepID=UPI00145DBFA2|nr:RluA family pseudouridine synthase [Ferrimonas sediminicola]